MGDAKRRKQQDSEYGKPLTYTAKLYSIEPDALLCEIPFTVPRLRGVFESNERAIAVAGLIFAYLQQPDNEGNQERVKLALGGEESLAILAEFWADDRVPKFRLVVDGDRMQFYNHLRDWASDDLPEFTTEAYQDGRQYQLQPENLMRLAV